MDKQQASATLAEHMQNYRAKPYEALRQLVGDVDAYEVTGPDGHDYQIEIQVIWDGKPEGNILVTGAIDDGGWSAFAPLSENFFVTPDSAIPRDEDP